MFPYVERVLRWPMCHLRRISPAVFHQLEPAMEALEAEVARLAGLLSGASAPADLESVLSWIDVAYDAAPLAHAAGDANVTRKVAILRLQYRLLSSMARAAIWADTLRICSRKSTNLSEWLRVKSPLRFQQTGDNCVANVMQFCLLRSQAYSAREIMIALSQPSCLNLARIAQQDYHDSRNRSLPVDEPQPTSARRRLSADLRAAIPANLVYVDRLAGREDAKTGVLRPGHFDVKLDHHMPVSLTVGGFCGMSDTRDVPPGHPQAPLHVRDSKENRRLRRERLSPAERHWLIRLEESVRDAGARHDYLLVVFDGCPSGLGHMVTVDLGAVEPGLFDPNLGFVDLPVQEWIGEHLLWLLCLLAVHYQASRLWFGGLEYRGPEVFTVLHELPPPAPRFRRVKRHHAFKARILRRL